HRVAIGIFSSSFFFFSFPAPSTTDISTLSLHDALPILRCRYCLHFGKSQRQWALRAPRRHGFPPYPTAAISENYQSPVRRKPAPEGCNVLRRVGHWHRQRPPAPR